jgi:hypothetical protein
VQIRLDQNLERIANLLGVGELFGARLKILKRLYPLEEFSSDKGGGFLVFRRHNQQLSWEGRWLTNLNPVNGSPRFRDESRAAPTPRYAPHRRT